MGDDMEPIGTAVESGRRLIILVGMTLELRPAPGMKLPTGIEADADDAGRSSPEDEPVGLRERSRDAAFINRVHGTKN